VNARRGGDRHAEEGSRETLPTKGSSAPEHLAEKSLVGHWSDEARGGLVAHAAADVVSKRPTVVVEGTDGRGLRVQEGPGGVAGALEQVLRTAVQAQFLPQFDQHAQPLVGRLEGIRLLGELIGEQAQVLAVELLERRWVGDRMLSGAQDRA